MSMDRREIGLILGVARAYLKLVDATTIAIGDGATGGVGLTRNQLAILINRFYREQPGVGTPPEFAES